MDEIESIQKEAKKLTDSGVNIIIAVGHAGFVKDKEIAEKVPQVDVVVGGNNEVITELERTVSELSFSNSALLPSKLFASNKRWR